MVFYQKYLNEFLSQYFKIFYFKLKILKKIFKFRFLAIINIFLKFGYMYISLNFCIYIQFWGFCKSGGRGTLENKSVGLDTIHH